MRKIWYKETIENEIIEFSSIKEWKAKSNGSYQAARRLKLLPELTVKLRKTKPRGFWTKENVSIEALKHTTIKSWRESSNSSSYSIAHRNGWLKELTAHMIPIGNKVKRLLYIYEFPDKAVYIGLTGDNKRRKDSHLTSPESPVFKHIKLTGNQPKYTELTTYLPAIDIADLEIRTIKSYKENYKENGWVVLNKKIGGQLGGAEKMWTKESCVLSTKDFKTRGEWKKAFPGAYHAACRYGWINEITSHMKYIIHPNNHWTKDKVLECALKCKSKEEWRQNNSGAYWAAKKNGWYEIATSHMPKRKSRLI